MGRCVGLGLAIAVAHFCLLFFWATPHDRDFRGRYDSLVQHDSYWFKRIIDFGYQTTIPPAPKKHMESSNVAFFPGFPLTAGFLVHKVGLDAKAGLIVASHLATWGFWTYLLLLLREWRVKRAHAFAAVGLIVAHPAALFLISAYSESLFLAMLLGYFFWNRRPGLTAAALATAHGFFATATRVAGFPAAVWPIVNTVLHRFRWLDGAPWHRLHRITAPPSSGWRGHLPTLSPWIRPILISGIAMMGTLGFFIYCHVRWGYWDMYMWTQENGWGVKPDYLALLKGYTYTQWWPDWRLPWTMGRFAVFATIVAFVGLAYTEVRAAHRRRTQWRERAGLYFIGFVLFFIAVSGVYSVRLESMIRYQFCTHVFLVLALVHLLRDFPIASASRRRWLGWTAVALALASLLVQLRYATIHFHGGWVA